MTEKCIIAGKSYDVIRMLKDPAHPERKIPLVDIPMISDEKWNVLVAKKGERNNEIYE